jgi:hypothetical protein
MSRTPLLKLVLICQTVAICIVIYSGLFLNQHNYVYLLYSWCLIIKICIRRKTCLNVNTMKLYSTSQSTADEYITWNVSTVK